MGIIMSIGVYAVHTGDTPMAKLQQDIVQAATNHPNVVQVHAFYYYDDQRLVTIDVVPDESIKNAAAFSELMKNDLHSLFPEYNFYIVVDFNYS